MSDSDNEAAKPENATAKIAVWWDMNDCPIPDDYDARRVRPSLEGEFKKLGYSGPVSITAYGDQTKAPLHLLRGLFSSGVVVAHTTKKSTCAVMYSDMLEWRAQNPPPATMMIISDHVEDVFSWDLVRLQQETRYNLFLSYSVSFSFFSVVVPSAKWRWKELLGSSDDNNIDKDKEIIIASAMFLCKSCRMRGQNLGKFRKHLSSKAHALSELLYPKSSQLAPVTEMWGKNYAAKPEHATAKIAVWWDMMDCPIPEGYDPRRVLASIQRKFKKLGYSGPVSITAFADQKQTPDHVLQGLSSTGVNFAHTIKEVTCVRMYENILKWQDVNPPPATIMLITNHVETVFSRFIVRKQQKKTYNLFLGYSFRPTKMSALFTSAEWLWDSLLGVSKSRGFHSCPVLQKCSGMGESTGMCESSGMFSCLMCYCDCNSFDNFRKHLSSTQHAHQEGRITASIETSWKDGHMRGMMELCEKFDKIKRLRRAFGMGFHHLHNRLRARSAARRAARRRPRKSKPARKSGEIVTQVTTSATIFA